MSERAAFYEALQAKGVGRCVHVYSPTTFMMQFQRSAKSDVMIEMDDGGEGGQGQQMSHQTRALRREASTPAIMYSGDTVVAWYRARLAHRAITVSGLQSCNFKKYVCTTYNEILTTYWYGKYRMYLF